jgi:hypothetical protein
MKKVWLLALLMTLGCTQNPKPSIQLAQTPTAHEAILKWKASNQKCWYRVWRSTTETGTYKEVKDAITVLTWTDTTVVGGDTYYYKVDCRNPNTNLVSANPRFSNIVKAIIP